MQRTRDRVLHPFRHARVLRQLRAMPRPRSILVICHGNICRSPYLASVLQRELYDVEVSSAGLAGPGRPVPDNGLTAAARRGVDMGAHRSRLLTRDLARGGELVVVMDAQQARALARHGVPSDRVIVAGDLDPEPCDHRTIQDPWGQPLDVFEMSYARLDRCALTLVESLRAL
jgi:protein-tyrosine phosphatase